MKGLCHNCCKTNVDLIIRDPSKGKVTIICTVCAKNELSK